MRAKELARSDPREQGVPDLPGRAGDSDGDFKCHDHILNAADASGGTADGIMHLRQPAGLQWFTTKHADIVLRGASLRYVLIVHGRAGSTL
ncbi:hypothetical protein GCM10027402_10480 [Arthrobacter monumenti]